MKGWELRDHRIGVEQMTQPQFADFLGVCTETICRWERDARPIPKRISDLIAHLDPPTQLPPKETRQRLWATWHRA